MSHKYALERPSTETPKIYKQDERSPKDDLVFHTSANEFLVSGRANVQVLTRQV